MTPDLANAYSEKEICSHVLGRLLDVSNTALVITILSVFAGFAFFTASFLSYMYKKPPVLTWTMMAIAIILITIIPTTIAVFFATLAF